MFSHKVARLLRRRPFLARCVTPALGAAAAPTAAFGLAPGPALASPLAGTASTLLQPLLRRSAKLAKKQLGAEHPHYATALGNLAAGLAEHGEADEARRHAEKALGISREALGEAHASTKELAATLERLGRTA